MKKLNLFNISPKVIIKIAKKLFELNNDLAKMNGSQFREEIAQNYADKIFGCSQRDIDNLYIEIRKLKHIQKYNSEYTNDIAGILSASCKVIGNIYETSDLTIFKYMNDGVGNRSIKQKKSVNDMVESFKKVGQMVPILVNRKLEVLEGQHRLDAAKLLQAAGHDFYIKFIITDLAMESEAQAIIEMGNGTKLFNINDNVKIWTSDDNKVFIMITLIAESLGINSKKLLDFLEIPKKATLDKYFTMELNSDEIISKYQLVQSLIDLTKEVILGHSDGVFSEARYFKCYKQIVDICDLSHFKSAIRKYGKNKLVPVGTNVQIHQGIWDTYNYKLTSNAINFSDYFLINKNSIIRKPV